MVTPGLVGLSISWLWRRETPVAIGLALTNWRLWAFAFCFPLAVEAIILAIAYAYRYASDTPDFISLNTIRIPGEDYQHLRGAWSLLGLTAAFAVSIAPYLAIAFIELRRATAKLSGRNVRLGQYLAETVAWIAVFFLNHSALVDFRFRLPGELGEEIGWRGFLVRRWIDRPLMQL